MALFLTVVAGVVGLCVSQVVYECPADWHTFKENCYRFEGDLRATYDDARSSCNLNGAGVVGVETQAENSFITQWLQQNDPFQQEWYTSGVQDSRDSAQTGSGFIWESTGEQVDIVLNSLWLQQPLPTMRNGVIIYSVGKSGPGWVLADPSVKRPYICKIPKKEAYRILDTSRGFDYGSDVEDIEQVERGPHFLVQPVSIVVISRRDRRVEPANLECVVQAKPQATYKWFRGDNFEIDVTRDLDSRFTITNGKLTIEQPDVVKDSGIYRCLAENKFGKVISNDVEITFGSLGEFNNVQDAGTRAKAFDGATLECSQIQHKPAISYRWIKGSSQQFVRPEFQDYIFISNNGKLYFSEVTRNDEDEYMCLAILTGVNRFTIGTNQPPMRTSLPIPLIVDDQAPKSNWGPKIQNDFIAVFPKPPMRGQDVRLECFAYGSSNTPFTYSWDREDKPMPKSAKMYDHNRVLMIRDAQLEDSGIYRCTVRRGAQASDTKTVQLNLAASPFFVSPLKDQHADIDSQLTWICNARANPDPVYRWYKNGQLLKTDSNFHMQVQKNVLTISQLDPDLHNGMYQCAAENSHGVSLSNAQLRVLAFVPTINKYPPPKSIMASRGGNVTVRCQPEGAPFPTVQWTKNGSPIVSDKTKYTIFLNGNLHITLLDAGDRGVYTCKATNIFGEAEASTVLDVTEGASITMAPIDLTSNMNETLFLTCEASHPDKLEMVYEWTFNGFPVDYGEPFYRQVQNARPGRNGLYVISAQFRHEGKYSCIARTPFSADSKSAYVTIRGPPREPAGIHALSETVTTNSTELLWTAGSASGGVISVHIIQVSNEFEPDLWEDIMTVRVIDSYREMDPKEGRHSIVVEGLNPGTGYRFRVLAQNEFGRGTPSLPSVYIQTFSAAPAVSPRHVRGGGGSVGDLTFRWDSLHKSEYGSQSVGYRLFWRKKDDSVQDGLWGLEEIHDPQADHLALLVGAENYYMIYEVKMQAFNDIGFGPNTSVSEVYSAEELPIATPLNVNSDTYNESAIVVAWDPVPDNRRFARGKILGYQINYWYEDDDPDLHMQSIRYYGQVDTGMVIGLDVDVNVIVDVQVYNSAGLGPRSNYYIMETSGYAPLHYPQEVHISSAGPHMARIWWRGISISVDEEALTGYAIWLWTASEDARTAELIEIEGITFHYILKNISDNRLYAMRLAAIGQGGYGRKTPTMYFTMEGEILIDSRFAETIDVFLSDGIMLQPSLMLLYISLLITVFHHHFTKIPYYIQT